MADLFRKYKSLYSSTANSFSTGSGVTITPASVVGLPTDTEITLTFDRVDSSGTATPSSTERIIGTVSGSNFVIRTSPSSGRGADSSTEQAHTSPVVEMIWNAKDWNDAIDGFLTEHGQDGTHDSTIVKTTTAQTLTNKTLTSPKINENVALTATATELNLLDGVTSLPSGDGWTPAGETWTYASATTFTVAGVDVTAKYQKGTRIKLTQTTAKYFVVTGSSFSTDTTVTITGGTDYTLANATITSPYYSYQANPQGYPGTFAYTPTLTNGNADLSGYDLARFSVLGNKVDIEIRADNRSMSGSSGACLISTPVLPKYANTPIFCVYNGDYNYVITDTTNGLGVYKGVAGNWAGSETGVYLKINGSYEI